MAVCFSRFGCCFSLVAMLRSWQRTLAGKLCFAVRGRRRVGKRRAARSRKLVEDGLHAGLTDNARVGEDEASRDALGAQYSAGIGGTTRRLAAGQFNDSLLDGMEFGECQMGQFCDESTLVFISIAFAARKIARALEHPTTNCAPTSKKLLPRISLTRPGPPPFVFIWCATKCWPWHEAAARSERGAVDPSRKPEWCALQGSNL